jgi:uncharacterized protein (DUF1501 family)
VALSALVPGFVAGAARAARAGKDRVLVVLEMTGGNDGLNTVIPYADDLYHKARPTLRYDRNQVVRVDDHIGLNPGMRSFGDLLQKGRLAIVQGVGYPNPDRSHFESMDIWQSADPRRKVGSGWIGRGLNSIQVAEGHIPGIHVGERKLPLALQGSATGTPTVQLEKPFDLNLGEVSDPLRSGPQAVLEPPPGPEDKKVDPRREARMKLIREITAASSSGPDAPGDLLQFSQRTSLQTYAAIDRLREIMHEQRQDRQRQPRFYSPLGQKLQLVARMIQAGFGTRIFYVAIEGFDTHANQKQEHQQLLQSVADSVLGFFDLLEQSGHAQRVLLMTFSEFGRRVQENGSRGTDHGAASSLFVAGPAVKPGPVGKHPSLAANDLDSGDLKHSMDFRQVYATLLDRWLDCDSQAVLGSRFEHVPLLNL